MFTKYERASILLGIFGPLVAYVSIGISIVSSSWFSWEKNALSDLGHSVKSEVAPIFNLGLFLAGSLMLIYTVLVFRNHAKYSSFFLAISVFSLQLIAVFDEVYGSIHFLVSVAFFLSIGVTSIVYAAEQKSLSPFVAFMIGFTSWIFYFFGFYKLGIAVPETISSLAVASILVTSAIRIYLRNTQTRFNT